MDKKKNKSSLNGHKSLCRQVPLTIKREIHHEEKVLSLQVSAESAPGAVCQAASLYRSVLTLTTMETLACLNEYKISMLL